MNSRARAWSAGWTFGLALLFLFVAGSLFAAPAPASAHGGTGSAATPRDGAMLDTSPEHVQVVLPADITTVGEMVIVDRSGRDWGQVPARIEGRTLSRRLQPGMPQGTYVMRWRVTFTDGHPATGSAEFSVGATATGARNPFALRVTPAGVAVFYATSAAVVIGLLLAIVVQARGLYGRADNHREGSAH
nr:copper resistance protein CopC [Micromonospora acroterricola]